ncbi:hypothetical protein FH972_021345 [Carpinus fangiana]|uniref:MARVEL domain-containing protein n=1 Tax=Carpinus fangiana TaxID=176857 RepID=A0A5N6KP56_9ROSI|nr:hypothetical protein FH972_021345 [Carpinus fangiana]
MAAAPPSANKKEVEVSVRPRNSSGDSLSLKSPRTARFAEATSVNSPMDGPTAQGRSPFHDDNIAPATTTHYQPQPQPSDVGFGYIGGNGPADRNSGIEMPATPRSPLKSALRSPGAAPRKIEAAILSPTFKEEQMLEKEEKKTEKQQAVDLKQKIRVRMAKMFLRFTNFSCSLIVVSMLAATFTIFNATKTIPPRNNLPAWSKTTISWPQITVLCIACISLLASIIVFWAYWKGGHRRAEKAAVYYSAFAVVFFVISIVMWAIGAAVLQQSRNSSGGNDIWSWSCKDNERKQLFQGDVEYDVVCRMQNWSLICCLIEVVVEVLTILIYGVVFYRYYSKRKLRKSMAVRDRARSDLYLAQLRSQSAPNTPGLASPRFPGGPLSPRDGGYNPMFSPRFAGFHEADKAANELSDAEEGNQYAAVEIPGAYASPIASPHYAPPQGQFFGQQR